MWSVLDTSPFATWVNTAPWPYPTFLSLHGLGMAVMVGITTMVALRVLGFPKSVPLGGYRATAPYLIGAFAVNAMSGTALFVAMASELAVNISFQLKLVAIVIGLFVTWRMYKGSVAAAQAQSDAGLGEYLPTGRDRAWAIAALLIWGVSVITSGRLIAYVKPVF